MEFKKFSWSVNHLRSRDNSCKWFNEILCEEEYDCLLMGIPLDSGVNYRPGTRFAPNSIREELAKNTTFLLDKRKSFSSLRLKDFGDLIIGNSFCDSHNLIKKNVQEITFGEKKNIFLGGDHSITYSILSELNDVKSLIVLDSHLDCREPKDGFEHSGNWLYKVIEEKIINSDKIYIIGASANNYSQKYLTYLENKGVTIITLSEYRKSQDLIKILEKKLFGDTIYLTIDIDCIDQSQAPGTSAPSSFGFYSNEIYNFVFESMGKLNLKYLDLVEVNPMLDRDNQTSKVASQILLHYLSGGE